LTKKRSEGEKAFEWMVPKRYLYNQKTKDKGGITGSLVDLEPPEGDLMKKCASKKKIRERAKKMGKRIIFGVCVPQWE